MPSRNFGFSDPVVHVAKSGCELAAQFRIFGRMAQPVAQAQNLSSQMNTVQRIGNLSLHRLRLRSKQRTELRRTVLLAPLPDFRIRPFSSEGAKRIIADSKMQTLGIARQIARQKNLEPHQRKKYCQSPGHGTVEK